jgi:membrane protein
VANLKERVTDTVDEVRERGPFIDHILRMLKHYSNVRGSLQAGAVTYFAFLSFFPILALAFFVVGYVANVVPDAQDALETAISEMLPGLIGDKEGQISLSTFQENAGLALGLGLLGVLYSGLGWLSGMRQALGEMFVKAPHERLNLVLGKLRDLLVLVVIGVTLLISVGLSGATAWFSELILVDWLNLGGNVVATVLLWVITHGLGVASAALLLFAMFRLLSRPAVPDVALWQGALLGALGFELLKSLASYLVAATKDSPSFQLFGVALILLVWINYFSRLVMYGAAWAYTSPRNDHADEPEVDASEAMAEPRPHHEAAVAPARQVAGAADRGRSKRALAMAGAAAGLAAAGAVALRKHQAPD